MSRTTPGRIPRREILTAASVCALLVLAVVAIYGQTLSHGLVNYDDPDYICNQPYVSQGLTPRSVVWAFTEFHACNWHPLTWLSHMLDCQVFGSWFGGHHLTNLLLHTAVAVSLFLVLWRMTESLWPSAFVAAVFAVHPLRVESVAWIAERKDLLSGLFFVWTLAAYVGYVKRRQATRYLLVSLLFALGLLAKPMIVTLPFVLLLLDYWPLGRLRTSSVIAETTSPSAPSTSRRPIPSLTVDPRLWQLVWEKVPLFAMSLASSLITVQAQRAAIAENIHLSLFDRLGNATVSYVRYLISFCHPTNLAVIYPLPPNSYPKMLVVGAAIVLIAITVVVLLARRRHPYLIVGWLWYLGMLVPVIGLVQVGFQAMADRYTYLPQIGLCIAIAWGGAQLTQEWPRQRLVCASLSAIMIGNLFLCAWQQASYWSDSITLWTHTLKCTEDNPVAHNNLGSALLMFGQHGDAEVQLKKAIAIDSRYSDAYSRLGKSLLDQGRGEEALTLYRQAISLVPESPVLHNDLGNVLAVRGDRMAAIAEYRKALELQPDWFETHCNLALNLAADREWEESLKHYRRALDLRPWHETARIGLAYVLSNIGQLEEAAVLCRDTAELWPRSADVRFCLAAVLRRQYRADEALAQLRVCLQLDPSHENARRLLQEMSSTSSPGQSSEADKQQTSKTRNR